jgi:hypothetical protein
MVIRCSKRNCGWLMADLAIAMGILVIAMLPLSASFVHEQKLCRIYYHKAVAMEIVDGEFEVLLSGHHKNLKPGVQPYEIRSAAATNLPPGQFVLTLEPGHLMLEWLPAKKWGGGRVFREADI